jgi:hypothetical protein
MAIKANLVIDQGTSFSTLINITDTDDTSIDLTGFVGAAQMRKHFSSSNSTPFVVTIIPAEGALTLALSANTTANLVAGRYVYDVELTNENGIISRIVEGIVTVTPNVTR